MSLAESRATYLQLKRMAKQQAVVFQALLDQYACERLLYRLSTTPAGEDFVLKGAMMLVVWTGNRLRATRDMDLRGLGAPDIDATARAFRAACMADSADGLVFDVAAIRTQPIKFAASYTGVNLTIPCRLDKARLTCIVEVGFTDVITPDPTFVEYPSLLEHQPAARIKAYPIETTIAEKFSIMIELGQVNTRFKDYHDLWALGARCGLSERTLRPALERTFAQRRLPTPSPEDWILSSGAISDARANQGWETYRRKLIPTVDIGWEQIVMSISNLLGPVCERWNAAQLGTRNWAPGTGWTT